MSSRPSPDTASSTILQAGHGNKDAVGAANQKNLPWLAAAQANRWPSMQCLSIWRSLPCQAVWGGTAACRRPQSTGLYFDAAAVDLTVTTLPLAVFFAADVGLDG